MQRSFLGEIRTLRPCAACRGFGAIIPEPCRECSGDGRVRSRRTITVKIPAGVDTGTRVQLTEQGEVGPGGGPAGDLYVEIHVARHAAVHPARQRPALHGHAADDAPRRSARRSTLPTLEADVEQGADSDVETTVRRSTSAPAPSPAPSRCCAAAACPACAGGRGDLVVTVVVETPTRLDERQEELLRELAALRGEEQPDRPVRPGRSRCSAGCATRSTRTDVAAGARRALAGRRRRAARAVEVDRRRGAPRRRRTPAPGGRAGRADRRRGRSVTGAVASTGKRVF